MLASEQQIQACQKTYITLHQIVKYKNGILIIVCCNFVELMQTTN